MSGNLTDYECRIAYKELKEAIKRGAGLAQALTPPCLRDLSRARKARDMIWPILAEETDVTDADREHAEKLQDLMQKLVDGRARALRIPIH